MHRGTHEVDFVSGFEHLHADRHFEEPVRQALGDRTFDLVIAAYGRLRLLVGLLAGRTDRLIAIGGTVYERQRWSRPADETAGRDVSHKLVARVQETEDAIVQVFADGTFAGTHVRYPNLYGPRQLAPSEWSVIRRILDGRTTIPVMDGGLTLESRAYVENAAHAVLLAGAAEAGSSASSPALRLMRRPPLHRVPTGVGGRRQRGQPLGDEAELGHRGLGHRRRHAQLVQQLGGGGHLVGPPQVVAGQPVDQMPEEGAVGCLDLVHQVLPQPVGAPGRVAGPHGLHHQRGQALDHDAAQQLACCGVPGAGADSLHAHAEGRHQLHEPFGLGPRRQPGVRMPLPGTVAIMPTSTSSKPNRAASWCSSRLRDGAPLPMST